MSEQFTKLHQGNMGQWAHELKSAINRRDNPVIPREIVRTDINRLESLAKITPIAKAILSEQIDAQSAPAEIEAGGDHELGTGKSSNAA